MALRHSPARFLRLHEALIASYTPAEAANLECLVQVGRPSERPSDNSIWKVIAMKTKFISAAVLAVSLMGLGGCAGMSDRQTVGTVGGAVVGGLVGDAVGGTGATILGAGAGALLGNQMTKPGGALNR